MEAARMIQSALRGYMARQRFKMALGAVWRSAIDRASRKKYYYNTRTGVVQWKRPVVLGPDSPRASTKEERRSFRAMVGD